MKTCTLVSGQECMIRPYTSDDFTAVKEILEESELFDAQWDSEENLALMIDLSPSAVLVATVNEMVVGSVYIHVYGNWASIWRLATHPSYRKQGVATFLLKTAQDILRNRGVPEAFLFISAQDDQLEGFYERRGWQDGGTYRLMSKKV